MKKLEKRLRMSYDSRFELAESFAKNLLRKMKDKESNLALAADVWNVKEFLNLIEQTGNELIIVKTHLDIMKCSGYKAIDDLIERLHELSEEYGFFIFEDRKFADIPKISKKQYSKGVSKIVDWAHLVSAHPIPGSGLIKELYKIAEPRIKEGNSRGLILISQMTSKGNLATSSYAKKTIKIAEKYPEFVTGFISSSNPKKLEELAAKADPKFIIFTPAVKIGSPIEKYQIYGDPREMINSGSDILIVGSGIHSTKNPKEAAKTYRKIGWDAYLKRINNN